MSGRALPSWRQCNGCGVVALVKTTTHRIRVDGVRVKCGSFRVV